MRKTSNITAKQTGRIGQYNDLRQEAAASSYLMPYADGGLTLKVSPGNIYFGSTMIEFAGGDSPSFTAPSTNPRIDILSIDNTGTLVRTAGSEASTPVAPLLPTGNIPICQVYNRVGQTEITEIDDTANGYILKDLRLFIRDFQPNQIVAYDNTVHTNSNASLSETDFYSFNVPAGLLSQVGRILRFTVFIQNVVRNGSGSGTATFKIYFGGSLIDTFNVSGDPARPLTPYTLEIQATGANSQVWHSFCSFFKSWGSSIPSIEGLTSPGVGTSGANSAVDNVIKISLSKTGASGGITAGFNGAKLEVLTI